MINSWWHLDEDLLYAFSSKSAASALLFLPVALLAISSALVM